MKQHLNIQKFWGETENAVRIQIYAAITAYCMVAIVQHDIGTELSIFEVLETVSLVLAERIPLTDLLCNTNFKNVNELTGFCEPTLNSNHREVNRQYYPTEQLRQSNAIKNNDSTHKA